MVGPQLCENTRHSREVPMWTLLAGSNPASSHQPTSNLRPALAQLLWQEGKARPVLNWWPKQWSAKIVGQICADLGPNFSLFILHLFILWSGIQLTSFPFAKIPTNNHNALCQTNLHISSTILFHWSGYLVVLVLIQLHCFYWTIVIIWQLCKISYLKVIRFTKKRTKSEVNSDLAPLGEL